MTRRSVRRVYGPDLDRAHARRRDAGGDRGRLVEILRLDQVEAAELLLRLGERPVRGEELGVADAHRPRGPRGLERLSSPVVAARSNALRERAVFREEAPHLRLRNSFPLLLVRVDEEEVLHCRLPFAGRILPPTLPRRMRPGKSTGNGGAGKETP